MPDNPADQVWSTSDAWFDESDSTTAIFYTEQTDKNEVAIHIRESADWTDTSHRAGLYLEPLDAVQFAEQIIQQARKAAGR
jgi:hypothetical protein